MNTTVERKALQLSSGHDKVMLHSCCAPCSGEAMEAMLASGIDYTLTAFGHYYTARTSPDQSRDQVFFQLFDGYSTPAP